MRCSHARSLLPGFLCWILVGDCVTTLCHTYLVLVFSSLHSSRASKKAAFLSYTSVLHGFICLVLHPRLHGLVLNGCEGKLFGTVADRGQHGDVPQPVGDGYVERLLHLSLRSCSCCHHFPTTTLAGDLLYAVLVAAQLWMSSWTSRRGRCATAATMVCHACSVCAVPSTAAQLPELDTRRLINALASIGSLDDRMTDAGGGPTLTSATPAG